MGMGKRPSQVKADHLDRPEDIIEPAEQNRKYNQWNSQYVDRRIDTNARRLHEPYGRLLRSFQYPEEKRELICCKTDVSSSNGNQRTNLPPSNLHPSNAAQSALLGDRWRGPLYGKIEGCPDYASTNACQQHYPNIYLPRANITWRSRSTQFAYRIRDRDTEVHSQRNIFGL